MTQTSSRVRFTVPGDRLAVIEECKPGPGTYEDSGFIYSKCVGVAHLDPVRKVVSVKEAKTPLLPKEGSTVIGVVKDAQERMAIISIFIIDGKISSNHFTGVLHIHSSSPKYERAMNEVCKVGDILKARVINVKNRIPELSTVGSELGVVVAYCSRCGGMLIKRSNKLLCEVCGNAENRKTSSDYGEALR